MAARAAKLRERRWVEKSEDSGMTNHEFRMTKEARNPKMTRADCGFGFRASGFLRISSFDFRISGVPCQMTLLPVSASARNTRHGPPQRAESGHPERGVSALADAQTASALSDLRGHVSGRPAGFAATELLFPRIDGHAYFRLHAHLVSPRGPVLSVGVAHLVVLYPQVDRAGVGGGGGGRKGERERK